MPRATEATEAADPTPRSDRRMHHGPTGTGPQTTILRRTVRTNLSVGGADSAAGARGVNGYAGLPAMSGWGVQYEIEVECRGVVDPTVGYLVDIKEVDRAVRSAVVPRLAEAVRRAAAGAREHPGAVMPEVARALDEELRGRLRSVRVHLSPYLSVEATMNDHKPGRVLLRQRFDFAASHRLHVPHLSAEENRRLFGKCNNPNGHGHNYQIEPCVALTPTPTGTSLTAERLEAIIDAALIEPFDHKYLNEDTREFAPGTGVNPSVENIAMVFYTILAPRIREAEAGAELVHLTVWETDRTSSTYPG